MQTSKVPGVNCEQAASQHVPHNTGAVYSHFSFLAENKDVVTQLVRCGVLGNSIGPALSSADTLRSQRDKRSLFSA